MYSYLSFRDKGNLHNVFFNFFSPTGFVSNTPLIDTHSDWHMLALAWHWYCLTGFPCCPSLLAWWSWILHHEFIFNAPAWRKEVRFASVHFSPLQKAMSTWGSCIVPSAAKATGVTVPPVASPLNLSRCWSSPKTRIPPSTPPRVDFVYKEFQLWDAFLSSRASILLFFQTFKYTPEV